MSPEPQGLHDARGFQAAAAACGDGAGPSIDSNGIVWTTTGDGQYDPSDPKNLILANSMVGFEQEKDGAWHVKDWFTPPNWDWLAEARPGSEQHGNHLHV